MQTANQLDWKNLSFQYLPTNCFVRVECTDGVWGTPETITDPMISLHVAANVLHYGQACFEGLKAFTMKDGTIAMFRPNMNARRLAYSAGRLYMQAPSEELFIEACKLAINKNREFVPPYGTGAALYIRPLIIGTEPMIGIAASHTYSFYVIVTPVGPYYKEGFFPVEAMVMDEYDRASPRGTGKAKVAGNYAASLKPYYTGKERGYPIILFTDPAEHKYVDEFGTSNFIGITPDGIYKTPCSPSILESITNLSLQQLATDMGLTVKCEQIEVNGLDQFEEVGACGTAAVVTPIYAVHYGDKVFKFGDPCCAGEKLTDLFTTLQGIQYGDVEDKYGWMLAVE
jgi:branched-chain amino acid aminotransferase